MPNTPWLFPNRRGISLVGVYGTLSLVMHDNSTALMTSHHTQQVMSCNQPLPRKYVYLRPFRRCGPRQAGLGLHIVSLRLNHFACMILDETWGPRCYFRHGFISHVQVELAIQVTTLVAFNGGELNVRELCYLDDDYIAQNIAGY